MIHNEQQTVDLEDEEYVDTIVVGLRYTGTKSVVPPRRPRDQGGWPGRATFQGGPVAERDEDGTVVEREPGPMQLGIVPDRVDGDHVDGGSLPGLENLPDFEVIYDPAELAQVLLEENYLPPDAFGGPESNPDYEIRQRVFDWLDVPDRLGTAPAAGPELREALAETAGIDVDEEEPPDASRKREYKAGHTRSDLYHAANTLGHEVEWATAKKTELAELLAEEPAAEVREALEAVADD